MIPHSLRRYMTDDDLTDEELHDDEYGDAERLWRE